MDGRLPDFLVIGAMKSATTSLDEQLARQPGLFMARPKEPNFFSDDEVHARGIAWYRSLFADAGEADLLGETSTHYAKLPTYPGTVERIARSLGRRIKIIYVMRHPIDRLISQFRHERNVRKIPRDMSIDEAVRAYPILVDYSRYSVQIRPYLDTFGPAQVLPVFFRRLAAHPQAEMERLGRFLGIEGLRHDANLPPLNAAGDRLRHDPLRLALVNSPYLTPIRRRIVPRPVTRLVKRWLTDHDPAPELGPETETYLTDTFDLDLETLGGWLDVHLTCDNFRGVTADRPLEWGGSA